MTEEYLARDNQMRSEALSSRVSLLKSVSAANKPVIDFEGPKELAIDIEGETKEQNVFLDETGKEMSGVSALLGHGKKRVGQILMAGKRDRKTMIYVAIGVALFLFSTYSLITHLTSSSSSTSGASASLPSTKP